MAVVSLAGCFGQGAGLKPGGGSVAGKQSAGGGVVAGGTSGDAAFASGGRIATDGSPPNGGAGGSANGGSSVADSGSGGAGGGISGSIAGGSTSSGGTAGGIAAGGVASGGKAATGGTAGGGTGAGGAGVLDAALPNPDVPLQLPIGSQCVASTDCALGNCVDGICCEIACAGCKACKQTLTGQKDGTCAPAISGQDPHNFCTDQTAANQCGNDGMCDGAGACRNASTSHICTPASCSADNKTFTPATTCNGAGACTTATPQSCGAFQCATTGCLKTCALQTDCGASNYCNIPAGATSGTCAATKANGVTATQTFECTSGVVADGVCCNLACTGCSACTKALNGQTDGQCLPVPAGQVAHSACAASGTTCGLDGFCDGAGKCRYPAQGTSCGSSCAGTTLTTKTCDGAGACGSATSTCGGSLVCGTSTCKTNCTLDTDCVTGNYCATGGVCTAKLDNGAKCNTANQCPTGNSCVENVCCSSACGLTCKSCLGSKTGGADGTCANVTNGTACGAGQVCNTGTCGPCAGGTSCQPPNFSCKTGTLDCSTGTPVCNPTGNWAATHSCGAAASCNTSTNVATAAQMCDGSGNCPPLATTNCQFGCKGSVCATAKPKGATCSSSAECGTGAFCTDFVCCASASCGTCKACNLNGVGTCSPKATTASDTACPVSAANCMAGCDGAGNCKPATAGTVCGPASCTNGAPGNGQYTSPTFHPQTCNGTTTGTSACHLSTGNPGCTNPGHVVCLDANTCRGSCLQDTDCVDGYYCAIDGTCQLRKPSLPSSSCTGDQQCQSRVCLNGVCVQCDSQDDCPRNFPLCEGNACIPCFSDPLYQDEFDCSPTTDGSMASSVFCGTRTAGRADGSCGCGSLNECPVGNVCIGTTCFIRGGQPCVPGGTPCQTGTCPSGGGVCPWEGASAPCYTSSPSRPSNSGCAPGQFTCSEGGCTDANNAVISCCI